MTKRASEDFLGALHNKLAEILTEEIGKTLVDKDGNVVRPAAVLNVARQFLKDNNITSTLDNKPMKDLVEALPSFEDEDPAQPGCRLN